MLACVKQRYARHLASGKIDAWNTSAMKISSIEKVLYYKNKIVVLTEEIPTLIVIQIFLCLFMWSRY